MKVAGVKGIATEMNSHTHKRMVREGTFFFFSEDIKVDVSLVFCVF